MQPLWLKIFHQGKLVETRLFTEQQISIGSGAGLNLQLPGLSPWHALITKKLDAYYVFDLGSEQGTFVNGQRAAAETVLASGSVLSLGPYQVQFFTSPPVAGAGAPQAPLAQQGPQAAAPPAPLASAPPIDPQQAPQQGLASSPAGASPPPASAAPPHQPAGAPPQMPLTQKTPLPPQSPGGMPSPPPPLEPRPPAAAPPPAPVTQKAPPASAPPGHPPSAALQTAASPAQQPPAASPAQQAPPQLPHSQGPQPPPQQAPQQGLASSPAGASPPPAAAAPPHQPAGAPPQMPLTQETPLPPQSPGGMPSPPPPLEPRPPAAAPPPAPISAPQPAPYQAPPAGLPPVGGFSEAGAIGSYQKPDKKGFWNTFAPPSRLRSLDKYLQPSVGNLIEVLVAWRERVLSAFYFFKEGEVFMGTEKGCQIPMSNMLGLPKYKLLEIASGARVFLGNGVKGDLFQGKEQSTRTVHHLPGNQTVGIKPFEMARLDFNKNLKVYVRILEKQAPPPLAGLFNLRFSEAVALFLAALLSALLVFYVSVYAPAFLMEDTKFIEQELRAAVVKFEKKPKQKVYKMGKRDVKKRVKAKTVPVKKPKKAKKKKASLPSPKKRKTVKRRKIGLKKAPSKKTKLAGQAPGKKSPKKKKVKVGSVRPGGSVKTGKAGSSAKTKTPDPSKVGLLGIFGGGGRLKSLDKGSTGPGGLVGLAQEATGRAGTKESYEGQGIGTKTKELGTGGKGTSLVGIGGIKTKGRGSLSKGAGPLGSRGQISIEFGEDDMDVEGEIDRAAIFRVVQRNKAKIHNCYNMSLQSDSSLQGKIKLRWNILSGGKARSVRAVSDRVGSRRLVSCLSRVLGRLQFPSPPAGQTPVVSFPFTFSK